MAEPDWFGGCPDAPQMKHRAANLGYIAFISPFNNQITWRYTEYRGNLRQSPQFYAIGRVIPIAPYQPHRNSRKDLRLRHVQAANSSKLLDA
jgi:hypothetical protein